MTVTINGTSGITTPAVTNNGAYTGDGISFADGTPSNTLVTTTGGNVGIGTASPSALGKVLNLYGSAGVGASVALQSDNGAQFCTIYQGVTASDPTALFSNNGFKFATATAKDATGYSEKMRIDSSGNLLVNTTSSAGNFKLQVVNTDSSSNAVWLQNNSGNDRGIAVFKHSNATGGTTGNMASFQNASGTTVGSITSSNTATTYSTSSDYRLKENVAPMTDALATVSALKPVTYTWKADGSASQGFIAHELQAVVPDCVTGEKDAVDADGNPVYQGIDTSFLVATLTAAIQELKAQLDESNLILTSVKTELDTVKTELATLKGTV